MNNSKLYKTLDIIVQNQPASFKKFLLSPYYNSEKALVNLFDTIAKHIKSGSDRELAKEKVWRRLRKNESYQDVRFRKYCSDLLKLAEQFIALQEYERYPIQNTIFLMKGVGGRKAKKLQRGAIRQAKDDLNKFPYRNAAFFYNSYCKEKELYNISDFDNRRNERTNVEDIANNLDAFYIAEKLRLYCTVLMRQIHENVDYDLRFIEDIMNMVQENEVILQEPVVAIYYQACQTIQENNEDHYYKLKDLLKEFHTIFPDEEGLELYYIGINYSIKKFNLGKQEFVEEALNLYKEMIEHSILFVNEKMSPWDFNNIISLAVRCHQFDWAEAFINQHSTRLPETFRRNAVTYSLALVNFHKKQYDKVLNHLQNVEYEDISYNLNSKMMLVAVYYELDEIEVLFSFLDSFRAFLNRHKDISTSKRKYYLNLIKFTKKLSKIIPGDQKATEKLTAEIAQTKEVVSKKWLLEKIEELH